MRIAIALNFNGNLNEMAGAFFEAKPDLGIRPSAAFTEIARDESARSVLPVAGAKARSRFNENASSSRLSTLPANLLCIADVPTPIYVLEGNLTESIKPDSIKYIHTGRRVRSLPAFSVRSESIARSIERDKSYMGRSGVWDGEYIAVDDYRITRSPDFQEVPKVELTCSWAQYSDFLSIMEAFRDELIVKGYASDAWHKHGLYEHDWHRAPPGLCFGHPINLAVISGKDMKILMTTRSKEMGVAGGETSVVVNENLKRGEQIGDLLGRCFNEEVGTETDHIELLAVIADTLVPSVNIYGYALFPECSAEDLRRDYIKAKDKEIIQFEEHDWNVKSASKLIVELFLKHRVGYHIAAVVYCAAVHYFKCKSVLDKMIVQYWRESSPFEYERMRGQRWWFRR